MKSHPFSPILLAVTALTSGCGGDISPEGTYEGKLVFEDGSENVTLELLVSGKARLKGLFRNTREGIWEKEATGLGFSKDGVMATFDGRRSNVEYRVVFMLQQAEKGLILADLRVRLLGETSMLQSFVLKEKKPLLKRVN